MDKLFKLNSELIEEINNKYQIELDSRLRENNSKEKDSFIEEINDLIHLLQSVDKEKLSSIIEIAFQSSFEREEGRFHHYSLIILPPQDSNELDQLYIFEKEQSLTKLPKLAPAIENSNQSFFAWFNSNNEPEIWAFGSLVSDYLALKITTFSAGQIIVHIPTIPQSHFVISLLKTGFVNKVPIFNDILYQLSKFSSLDNLFAKIRGGKSSQEINSEKFNIETVQREFHQYMIHSLYFQNIAQKMRHHLHGGTLLVVADSTKLEQSIQKSIPFKAKSNYDELKKSVIEEENKFIEKREKKIKTLPFFLDSSERFANENRANLLNLIGQLTAVDGATILTKDFDLIAFGAKIESKKNDELEALEITVEEPFENSMEENVKVSNFHGTRHQSVAKFIFEQKENAFGIVTSQDGRVSVVYWDKETEKVCAIRHAEYLFL